MKNKIMVLAMVLLLLPMASAEIVVNKYTNEFALSSNVISGKACSCADFEFPFTVDNVGDEEGVFHVSVKSEKDWFSPEEDSFGLKAGESKASNVVASVPCGWTGTVDYSVVVDSTYGRQKALDRTLEVVQCQNLLVEEGATKQVVNPGETAVFSFKVKNTASFDETYKVNVGDYKDNVEISAGEFELSGDGSKEVFVYVRFPDDRWGEFNVPVKISAERNGLSQDLNLYTKVRRAYGFSLDAESRVKACSGIEQEVPVTIRNDAEVENTYDLSMSGPRFARMSTQRVTLEPGDSTTFTVKLNPEKAGKSDIGITATSLKGSIDRSTEVGVDVEDCYGHDVSVAPKTVLVCGAAEVPVNVRNLGTKDAKLALSLDAPGWAILESNSVSLNSAENKNVLLQLAPPCADSEYEVGVKAVNREVPEFTDSASSQVRVYTPESAYEVELEERNFDVGYDQEELEVKVNNVGIRNGTYTVDVDSKFLEPLQEEISISAGESGKLRFSIGNTSGLGYGEYLHGLSLTLAGSNVSYAADIGTNLKGPGLLVRAGGWLMETLVYSQWYCTIGLCGWSGIVLLFALAALVIVEVMVLRDKVKTQRFTVDYRTHFRILQSVFAVVVVLGLIFFVVSFSPYKPGLYETPSNEGDLVHNIYEGQDYTIDLSRYFEDPDEDVLEYGYESDNVSVSFEGSVARLEGEGSVRFTATDVEGATEISPVMEVNVLERKEDANWVDVWLANCQEFNALLASLIFLFLIILSDSIAPRGRDYYFGGR